ncbi:MAG: SDR family oxidoreductase [Marinifilaceae bacterium]
MNLFDVKDNVVVITGGYGILGYSIATSFAQHGAKVAIVGRNKEKGEAAVRELNQWTENIFVQADVSKHNEVIAAAKEINDYYGKIDVLINAAGGNMPGATIAPEQTIFDLDMEALGQVMDLNLTGTIMPSIEFGKYMVKQKSGSIINISSMSSQSVITRVLGYSVAKSAVDCFTRWMAVEMVKKFGEGVRVNAMAPGFFLTEQNRTLLTNPDGTYTSRAEDIVRNTPYGRMGKPEELHGTALWLASAASKFVTGVVVPIDGGFSIYSGV